MGRGRQKAKHQRVARDLKYRTSAIDTFALERELSGDDDDGFSFGGSAIDDAAEDGDAEDGMGRRSH